jgi:hypothetical protein
MIVDYRSAEGLWSLLGIFNAVLAAVFYARLRSASFEFDVGFLEDAAAYLRTNNAWAFWWD